jgi:ring-opening amidohydrolase-like protein
MHATVHRLPMRDPGDVSALAELIDRREIDPARIVAVLGNTEGNGLVNDYTRGYLTQSLKLLLRAHAERPLYIFSGGTEGVLSPHYVVFSARRRRLWGRSGARRHRPRILRKGLPVEPLAALRPCQRALAIHLHFNYFPPQ